MDNKYTTPEQAIAHFCPFKNNNRNRSDIALKHGLSINNVPRCDGEYCMAWRWTGYKVKTECMAVLSQEDKLYHNENVTSKVDTHGCCGLVYTGKIEKKEI